MSRPFNHAHFETSAADQSGWPHLTSVSGHPLPEVAVAGRSNVGKSSLLNHLFNTKKLVRTSVVPGKTQLLNFFSADKRIAFADLPGYGFAQVPLALRASWGAMVQTYLQKRKPLQLLLLLIDSRRGPDANDLELAAWAGQCHRPFIVVLTKMDKLNQSQAVRSRRQVAEQFEGAPVVPYSVKNGKWRDRLTALINETVEGA